MTTTIKRTTVLLLALFCMEIITAGSFAFATPGTATASSASTMSMMNVSDVIYTPPAPASDEVITPSKATEPEATPVEEPEVTSTDDPEYYYTDYTDYTYSSEKGIYIPSGTIVSGADFAYNGLYYDDNHLTYTYYPERNLPGGGLDIPGRHLNDEGYIVDGDGNLCISSDDFPKGTVLEVPFSTGIGVVYDTGSGKGNLDLYTAW